MVATLLMSFPSSPRKWFSGKWSRSASAQTDALSQNRRAGLGGFARTLAGSVELRPQPSVHLGPLLHLLGEAVAPSALVWHLLEKLVPSNVSANSQKGPVRSGTSRSPCTCPPRES